MYEQDFIKAGELAGQVRAFGKSLIKTGASYNQIITQIRQKIKDLGALPAFPPQIALNDVAAHYLPHPDQDIIFSNEVVKLDIGVCYHGAIGDCAVTVDLSGKHQSLINAVESALLAAEQSIQVGMPIRDIGKIIDERISFYGYTPVRNLCGHGLGKYRVHMPPCIPNCEDRSTHVIKPGMTFAIEPFATDGKGYIYGSGEPMIFSFKQGKPLRSELAKQLLAKVQTFRGLPFAMHDLEATLRPAVAELLAAKVLEGYEPLIEEEHGLVAQAENSVLVDKLGKVHITTRSCA